MRNGYFIHLDLFHNLFEELPITVFLQNVNKMRYWYRIYWKWIEREQDSFGESSEKKSSNYLVKQTFNKHETYHRRTIWTLLVSATRDHAFSSKKNTYWIIQEKIETIFYYLFVWLPQIFRVKRIQNFKKNIWSYGTL